MTPEDFARLTEEERAALRHFEKYERLNYDPEGFGPMIVSHLLAARRVVEAASWWGHWGNLKAIHVLTCKECERLEGAEDRWCEEASKIARTQLDAAKALQAALAATTRR